MTSYLTTKTSHTSLQGRRGRRAAAGLALLAAAAIGSFQLATHRDGTPASAPQHQPVSAAPVSRPALQPAAANQSFTVYVTGSVDEAAALRQAIQDGDRILEQLGRPLFNADVVVVASAEAEDGLRRGLAEADAIRTEMGLPPITVIDTRTP